jgi:hypothetical protein
MLPVKIATWRFAQEVGNPFASLAVLSERLVPCEGCTPHRWTTMQPYAHSRLLSPRGSSLHVSRSPTHTRPLVIIGHSKNIQLINACTLPQRLQRCMRCIGPGNRFTYFRKRISHARSTHYDRWPPHQRCRHTRRLAAKAEFSDHLCGVSLITSSV